MAGWLMPLSKKGRKWAYFQEFYAFSGQDAEFCTFDWSCTRMKDIIERAPTTKHLPMRLAEYNASQEGANFRGIAHEVCLTKLGMELRDLKAQYSFKKFAR